ncbi:diguanylate cyclase (GGDEF)-like protein [Herbaspirillum sp. Sphag1AN]|uniref:GGDEF domain-containing protein n=1 Tax=unclassified Herbaspirillum TaxID=2624150 RepID=UPI00161904B3|nr:MULTISPECIES: sensor domain-containing diguanylate cyclase [unclassified Herbaspirillum]MBB3211358.1 diguanylate cyclase (GGDEF)-like protein [Herbaspirillum sp. Sphag1AN]MBB3245375.1 diguanylate cyclase (GGDEF)-like protein [Herbaspirillum sp. Sphag64]
MTYTRRATDGSSVSPSLTADQDASPATRIASWTQRLTAMRIVAVLGVITIILSPFAQVKIPLVLAFLPAYQSIVIVAYLITSYLIHMQFQATRIVSLLHLSAASLYTAGVLIAQFLSFPNAFIANTQLLGGAQTTIWLWAYWHVGPAVGILFYAWAEYRHPNRLSDNPDRSTMLTALVLCAVFAFTIASVTIFKKWLPVMDINGDYSRADVIGVAPAIQIALAISLLVLWRASRLRTVLHVWLGVAVFALFCDNALTMMAGSRLTLGWYVGRANALLSATLIMCVYLREIRRAYMHTAMMAGKLIVSNAELAIRVDEARIDALTKLPMRDMLLEQADNMRMASVEAGAGFATLFIDLDGFKNINDRFGHEHGDIVLIRAADAVSSLLREQDIAGRIGGDEFVVCLTAPGDNLQKIATKLSERIVEKIAKIGEGIGASVGISVSNTSIDEAIRQADEAMYDSKKAGRNRSTIYRPKPQLVQHA